jgi:hypothetical protein
MVGNSTTNHHQKLSEAMDLAQVERINESIRENDMEDVEAIPNNVIPIFGDVFNEEQHPELLNVTFKDEKQFISAKSKLDV